MRARALHAARPCASAACAAPARVSAGHGAARSSRPPSARVPECHSRGPQHVHFANDSAAVHQAPTRPWRGSHRTPGITELSTPSRLRASGHRQRRALSSADVPGESAGGGCIADRHRRGQVGVRGAEPPDGSSSGDGQALCHHGVDDACLHQLSARGYQRSGRAPLRRAVEAARPGERLHGRRHDRHRGRVQGCDRVGGRIVRRAVRDDRAALADGRGQLRRAPARTRGRLRASRDRDRAHAQHPRRARAGRRSDHARGRRSCPSRWLRLRAATRSRWPTARAGNTTSRGS